MKVFITGSSGFIGRNLVEFYRDSEVYAAKREPIIPALDSFKPNVIINCAAEIYDQTSMMDSNVLNLHQILEWLKKNPESKLVQIGSSSEYGPMGRPTKETDKIDPIDMYQATKGMATLLCQGYSRSYDLDVCIARPYSVYGRYEKPHRLFPRLWRSFVLNERMNLYNGKHDFIYIDDFVRGVDILVHRTNVRRGDIINFGSGIQYGNFQVYEAFEKITGRSAPVSMINTMAKRFEGEVWVCDPSYARDRYGFTCAYSLEDGIKHFLSTARYESEAT